MCSAVHRAGGFLTPSLPLSLPPCCIPWSMRSHYPHLSVWCHLCNITWLLPNPQPLHEGSSRVGGALALPFTCNKLPKIRSPLTLLRVLQQVKGTGEGCGIPLHLAMDVRRCHRVLHAQRHLPGVPVAQPRTHFGVGRDGWACRVSHSIAGNQILSSEPECMVLAAPGETSRVGSVLSTSTRRRVEPSSPGGQRF